MLVQQGNLASVERSLVGRVLQGDSDSVLILEVLARAYLANYQLDQARESVRKWLELEPNRAEAWLLLRRSSIVFATRPRAWRVTADSWN